jgi:hypothetical protein
VHQPLPLKPLQLAPLQRRNLRLVHPQHPSRLRLRQQSQEAWVALEEAITVFDYPLAPILQDGKHSGDEERFITLGLSIAAGLLR